ncbi:MAG: outer membrane beta-barrel protein [Bacteroidota bacterium]
MKYFFPFISLYFCLLSWPVWGQSSLSGTITDPQGEALSFANVLLLEPGDSSLFKGMVSDETGKFLFKDLPNRSFLLEVRMMGFQSFFRLVSTSGADQMPLESLDVQLQEDQETLEAVTISAKKPLLEQKIDRTIVNVQNSVTATGATALEVLERSPGVQVNRLNQEISMQGKAGVIVMLNGKRMRMEMAAIIQLLEAMPSDQVEKIELIQAPPASYDAEGDAGIINIQSIKQSDEGFNASLSLNTGYGIGEKLGGAFNFNWRKKNFNLYGDISGNHNRNEQDTKINRSNFFGDQVTETVINSHRPARQGLYNFRLGLDYELSSKTRLGILTSGFQRIWRLDARTQSTIFSNTQPTFSSDLRAREDNDWTHGMLNVNLRHQFDNESEVSLDYDYLRYYDDNPVKYEDILRDENGALLELNESQSEKRTPIEIQVAKLDYNKKWSDKFQMQMGLKGTLSEFINDVSFSQLENQELVIDPRFTDEFTLDEKIGAAYISSDYQWSDKVSSKVGLRYEYYDSQLDSQAEGVLLEQSFGRLFPSLYLSIQLRRDQQLNFAYNERITRPAFNTLAPAFFFFGYNTVLAGNPAIRPTISRKITASYQHPSFLINFQFSDDDNPLTYQPQTEAEDNLTIIRIENMADAKTASLSLNVPLEISQWWESRYNIAWNWQKTVPIIEGLQIPQSIHYVTFQSTQNFSLPREYGFEISANLRSPQRYGLGRTVFIGSVNLGLQKTFRKNLKVTLSWNDIFDWGSFFQIDYDRPDLNLLYDWNYDLEGNIFRISLSWQLGNTGLKKSSGRKTGSEEERRRVN